MAPVRLRDRDAIMTAEGLIFRVFGYTHPPATYVCDLEYAPAEVFTSRDPRAFRTDGKQVYYKFYEDEAWKFIARKYPQYEFLYPTLQKKTMGVNRKDISKISIPHEELKRLIRKEPKDMLLETMENVLSLVLKRSGLSEKDFGVFGSLLHGFYHPQFSDIDFVIYGRDNAPKLRKVFETVFDEGNSQLRNEFENDESVRLKKWRFLNLTSQEFVRHQKRKMIYALFEAKESGRVIKVEFEPVKNWDEIIAEFDPETRILPKGWVKMQARVIEDGEGFFMPSVYDIEPLIVLYGDRSADEVVRVVSFMEEFRLQAFKDEKVYVEGNLEQVKAPAGDFYQITLTHCPRYYEQTLKVVA